MLAERAKHVRRAAQIDRLYVVGSNAETGPVIEASYRRFLEAFEAHLATQPFLLGGRPGAGDFAVFGQLSQLAQFDPTPMALTLKIAPRVYAWVSLMEDQSGLEPQDGDWIDLAAPPPPTLVALLKEIGRVYPPVMLANAQALSVGAPKASKPRSTASPGPSRRSPIRPSACNGCAPRGARYPARRARQSILSAGQNGVRQVSAPLCERVIWRQDQPLANHGRRITGGVCERWRGLAWRRT